MNKPPFPLSCDPFCFLEKNAGVLVFRPHPAQLLLPLLLHDWKIRSSSYQTIPVLSLLPQEHRTGDPRSGTTTGTFSSMPAPPKRMLTGARPAGGSIGADAPGRSLDAGEETLMTATSRDRQPVTTLQALPSLTLTTPKRKLFCEIKNNGGLNGLQSHREVVKQGLKPWPESRTQDLKIGCWTNQNGGGGRERDSI